MKFGEYFKELRMLSGHSLRSFCKEFDLDPGNISKLERGVMSAPKNEAKLEVLATALRISKGSDKYEKFMNLAEESQGFMKTEGLTDEEIAKKLPVFLRNADGDPINEDQLDNVVQIIKQAWTSSEF